MKIIHFPGSFIPTIGGAEIAIYNVIIRLHDMGHSVYVLLPDSKIKSLTTKKYFPFHLIGYSRFLFSISKKLRTTKVLSNLLFSHYIKSLQNKYRFDIWHFNMMGYQAFLSVPTLKLLGVPIVGTCHGADIQVMSEIGYGRRLEPKFNYEIENVINDFDILTANSGTMRNEYKKLGIPSKRVISVPAGVDYWRLNNTNICDDEVRIEYNIPFEKRIILSVGRNHPKKGFDQISLVISELLQFRDNFIWLLVGGGMEEILDTLEAYNLRDYVKHISEIGITKDYSNSVNSIDLPSRELIEIYKISDVFVFPTLLESFGQVFLEAMACSVPIVTTDAPGACDVIKHEYNGMVSKVFDYRAMANNIEKVLNDKLLRERLISNGHTEAKACDWDKISRLYHNSYKIAMKRGNK